MIWDLEALEGFPGNLKWRSLEATSLSPWCTHSCQDDCFAAGLEGAAMGLVARLDLGDQKDSSELV